MAGHAAPIGGLAYYISPPRDMVDILRDPIHCLFYVSFVMIACGLFAKIWIEISGASSRDVAKQLIEQNEEKLNVIIDASELGMWEYDLKTEKWSLVNQIIDTYLYKKNTSSFVHNNNLYFVFENTLKNYLP